jgi:hypothetical protein
MNAVIFLGVCISLGTLLAWLTWKAAKEIEEVGVFRPQRTDNQTIMGGRVVRVVPAYDPFIPVFSYVTKRIDPKTVKIEA